MALLTSEVARLRYELGYGLIGVGGEPYIGHAALFEAVIQPYLDGGATTTSATSVVASDTPALATLVLASATGFSVGDAVIVDVDALQERATIRALSGANMGVLLSKAHAGTYPVTVEGGESIVRAILQRLQVLSGLGVDGGAGGAMGEGIGVAGIKKIDDIEFFGSGGWSETQMAQYTRLREYWRDELAAALGIERNNGASGGGGSDCSVF